MTNEFKPEAIYTVVARPGGWDYVGIVFSKEQAAEYTANVPGSCYLVCIDIPRSRLCTSLVEATEFYQEG